MYFFSYTILEREKRERKIKKILTTEQYEKWKSEEIKKYKINRKIKFKKRKVGYFAMVNGRKLRFPFYTGIPSPNTKYWEKLEIEMIKNWITNLKK